MSDLDFIDEDNPIIHPRHKPKKRGYHRFEFHLDDQMRHVFVGNHTIFSVLGFTVGGMLIGGVLERIFIQELGLSLTLLIGFVLLFVSGIVLKIFND